MQREISKETETCQQVKVTVNTIEGNGGGCFCRSAVSLKAISGRIGAGMSTQS